MSAYRVGEPEDAAWDTAVERITQDGPPCVLDAEGEVVAVVLLVGAGADTRAQRIAAALNQPLAERLKPRIEEAIKALTGAFADEDPDEIPGMFGLKTALAEIERETTTEED